MDTILDFIARNYIFLLVIIGLLIVLVMQRSGATQLASVEKFDELSTAGKPVVVEFYNDT